MRVTAFANCIAIVLAFGDSSSAYQAHDDRRYLPAIQSLVFTKGQVSFSRKGEPHQQLSCTGGDAKDQQDATPLHVECFNRGLRPPRTEDERKFPAPQFTCIPSPPLRGCEMRNYSVKCEGYAFERDLYIVKNSCYLEYELWVTNASETSETKNVEADGKYPEGTPALWSTLQSILVLAGLFSLLYLAKRCKEQTEGLIADNEGTSLLASTAHGGVR